MSVTVRARTGSSPVTAPVRPAPTVRGRRARRTGLGLLGLLAVLAAWELVARALGSVVFPPFTTALAAVGGLLTGPTLTADILPSVARVAAGFAISAVLGVVLGLLLGYVRVLGDHCSGLLDLLRSLPTPLLIPAVLVLLGVGDRLVVAVVVSGAVWPVLLNAFDAARRVEPLYLDTARMCGLRGVELFRRVLLPATLPSIVAGLRVALSVSLVLVVVAETLGAYNGIGYFIKASQETFLVPQTYAGVIVLGVLGWASDTAFLAVERRVLAWERGMAGRHE